jgi:hypothetical protein
MSELREPAFFIDAAEQAAAAGDYAAAEHFLREAASRQEAELGPLSPELANTLNNLGVVSEMRQKPQDAEECYRKAYEIAAASLDPHHPFVETSRQNLSEFYKAQGRSLDPASFEPRPAEPAAIDPQPPSTDPARPAESALVIQAIRIGKAVSEAIKSRPNPLPGWTAAATGYLRHSIAPALAFVGKALSEAIRSRPNPLPGWTAAATGYLRHSIAPALAFGRFSRAFVVVLSCFTALLLVLIATLRVWLPSTGPTQPVVVSAMAAPAATAAPVESVAPRSGAANDTRAAASDMKARVTKAAAAPAIAIASGRLCRALSTASPTVAGDWRCEPVTSPVVSGSLYLYTRIKSERPTTVQHLWYRDSELIQAVDLPVQANQTNGFRTYSRYTINDRSAGNWRLEVKSRDGIVLHQERFIVR